MKIDVPWSEVKTEVIGGEMDKDRDDIARWKARH